MPSQSLWQSSGVSYTVSRGGASPLVVELPDPPVLDYTVNFTELVSHTRASVPAELSP